MARSLARELGSRSITANVVAPGFVDTDMTAVLTDDQKAAIQAQVPLRRYARARARWPRRSPGWPATVRHT